MGPLQTRKPARFFVLFFAMGFLQARNPERFFREFQDRGLERFDIPQAAWSVELRTRRNSELLRCGAPSGWVDPNCWGALV